jgi:GWxTD domain-containing protein
LLGALLASPAMARKGQSREKEDLINILLSPGLAQWLVGPVARIASDEETQAYLRLKDDSSAEAFIQEFWQKRGDPQNPWPGRQVRDIFDRRAEAADRLFTEGANLGRRTDRGEIFILFGEALKSGFVQDENRRARTVEIWLYDPKSRRGLHGAPPEESYFFTKIDGLTVFTGVPRTLGPTRIR